MCNTAGSIQNQHLASPPQRASGGMTMKKAVCTNHSQITRYMTTYRFRHRCTPATRPSTIPLFADLVSTTLVRSMHCPITRINVYHQHCLGLCRCLSCMLIATVKSNTIHAHCTSKRVSEHQYLTLVSRIGKRYL